MPETVVVTAADIARLAGVTRATVSNWRRRHADFPAATGGTDASPAYDRAEVEAWLAARGSLPELSPDERLWRAVIAAADDEPLGDIVAWAAHALKDQLGRGSKTRKTSRARAHTEAKRAAILTALADTLAARGPAKTLGALLDRYGDAAGVAATPRPVAELMASLAGSDLGVVLDPAGGTGELLEVALDRGAACVLGQELDNGLARLAEIRLDTSDRQGTAEVQTGDSLRDDKFVGIQADAVLCHPPFGERDWGQEELAHDTRWEYGIPPKAEPELAWVQHALAHLRPGGRAVMLLPPAVASRPSARRIRAGLLRRGTLRAVVSLPVGAVRPHHVPVHLWVLDRIADQGPVDPRVLLIEGAVRGDDVGGGSSPGGWLQFAETVITAWQAFTTDSSATDGEPGRWRVVRAIDVLDETVDVSPTRHVAPVESVTTPSQTAEEVRALTRRLRTLLAAVEGEMPGDNWPAGDRAPSWHTATIAELAKTGMVELQRGSGKLEGIRIRQGDVLVPVGGGGQVQATVATAEDDGTFLGQNRHLIRPNAAVLDPWFLAGMLIAPASVQQASYGTAATRIDARRLVVPLLPLPRQRRHGAAFKQLHDFDTTVTEFADLAGDLTGLLTRSLADRVLLPAEQAEAAEGTSE